MNPPLHLKANPPPHLKAKARLFTTIGGVFIVLHGSSPIFCESAEGSRSGGVNPQICAVLPAFAVGLSEEEWLAGKVEGTFVAGLP